MAVALKVEPLPYQVERRRQLPALTGLRFYAAVGVVMYHLWATWLRAMPGSGAFANGYVGVSVFFVLSGFILTYTYVNADGNLYGGLRRFYMARVARLYPIYICTALFGAPPVLVALMREHAAWSHTLAYASLTQGWFRESSMFDPPAWSLSCEALFYLLFPLCALALMRLPARSLPVIAISCWCGAMLMAVFIPHIDIEFPPFRLPEFLTGMTLGRWHALGYRIPRQAVWVSAAGLFLCFAASTHLPLVATQMGLTDPFGCAVIYGLAVSGTGGRLHFLLSSAPIILLGEASYSLYLLHWPLWIWFGILLQTTNTHIASNFGEGLIYLVILIPLSVIAYCYIEIPGRRFIRRLAVS